MRLHARDALPRGSCLRSVVVLGSDHGSVQAGCGLSGELSVNKTTPQGSVNGHRFLFSAHHSTSLGRHDDNHALLEALFEAQITVLHSNNTGGCG